MAKKTNTRRGNNEGSIFQRKDGRWVATVTLGYDDNGKRVRKTLYGKTRTDVAVKMSTLVGTTLQRGHTSIQNDNLQTIMQEWLITFKQADVTPRTFDGMLMRARNHIYPVFGEMKINEITSHQIQIFFNKMSLNGYAVATVRKVKFLLNQFFNYCKRCKYIYDNPVSDCIVKATAKQKEMAQNKYKAIPMDVREKFIATIGSHPFLGPLALTQMFGSLRIGEALALKWKNIDFENKTIEILAAITEMPEFDKNYNVVKRTTVIGETKTAASIRKNPMPEILANSLAELFERRKQEELETGVILTSPNSLVFGTKDGEVRSYSGTKCIYYRALKRAGLEKYNLHFHKLRHTYSNMLFESRENPQVIKMLMGHKDVDTTLRTYNSIDDWYYMQAAEKLEIKSIDYTTKTPPV
ncbi:MAG: site-specific integrase [Clostridia bacterium]|nr:site-specific integrase [Clostridia bacterium]